MFDSFSLIHSLVPDPEDLHRDSLWVREECFRYYVEVRRSTCKYDEILDLWLQAPYCEDCFLNDPLLSIRRMGEPLIPDITSFNWESDLLLSLGPEQLVNVKQSLAQDSDYSYACKSCGAELRPWDDDDIYIVSYHLEEHYGIPYSTPGRKNPPKKVREQIFKLYDHRCFRCDENNVQLHLDHIQPRAKGGDAAFRNLQPLCQACGDIKADKEATEIHITSLMYFDNPTSDVFEGLFW